MDTQPPQVFYSGPTGYINNNNPVLIGYWYDPYPSSTITGFATATVSLNGGGPQSCFVFGEYIYCYLYDIPDGHYDVQMRLADGAGNVGVANGYFNNDTRPPQITHFEPDTVINTNSAELIATWNDPLPSSGIDTSSLWVLMDGIPITCSFEGQDMHCPVSDLSDGSHNIELSLADTVGNRATVQESLQVCTGKPDLRMSLNNVFWASYDDYTLGLLSVEYGFRTTGKAAYDISITGQVITNGVVPATSLPVVVGSVPNFGGMIYATVQYLIPPGATGFRTSSTVSLVDACGQVHNYP